ncbi:MAG: hypothetical protein AMXMBFR53_32140 [Gemmatimonadota bacterium]
MSLEPEPLREHGAWDDVTVHRDLRAEPFERSGSHSGVVGPVEHVLVAPVRWRQPRKTF